MVGGKAWDVDRGQWGKWPPRRASPCGLHCVTVSSEVGTLSGRTDWGVSRRTPLFSASPAASTVACHLLLAAALHTPLQLRLPCDPFISLLSPCPHPRTMSAADSSPNLNLPSATPPPPPTRAFHNIHITVHCSISPSATVLYHLTAHHQTRTERRLHARQRKFDLVHSTRKAKRTQYRERVRDRKRQRREERPDSPPPLRGKRLREAVVEKSATAPRVCVDMAYEGLMADPDVHSLAKQIRILYADNVRAARPLRLVISSLKRGERAEGKERENEEKEEREEKEGMEGEGDGREGRLYECLDRNVGFHSWAMSTSPLHFLSLPPPPSPPPPASSFVYLTAESSQLLTSLDASLTYVIGGLVDHNRLKGHCNAEADRLQVPTARLPIAECMEVDMGRRAVITVNQVFDCLLGWWQGEGAREERKQGTKNGKEGEEWQQRWCDVFAKVLPKRGGWRVRERWRREEDNNGSRAAQGDGDSSMHDNEQESIHSDEG